MGVWNEPGMYLVSNSPSAGDCCPTSSTDWSMNACYLCINYAIISYRQQFRGEPSVCNDQCAGHSSWSEDAIVGAYDKGARGPWELGPRCSSASLGHQSEERGGKDSLIEATLAFWAAGSFEMLQGTSLDPCPPSNLGLLSLSTALQIPGRCAERGRSFPLSLFSTFLHQA